MDEFMAEFIQPVERVRRPVFSNNEPVIAIPIRRVPVSMSDIENIDSSNEIPIRPEPSNDVPPPVSNEVPPRTNSETTNVCKICLESIDLTNKSDILAPCGCDGTMKYIHRDCFVKLDRNTCLECGLSFIASRQHVVPPQRTFEEDMIGSILSMVRNQQLQVDLPPNFLSNYLNICMLLLRGDYWGAFFVFEQMTMHDPFFTFKQYMKALMVISLLAIRNPYVTLKHYLKQSHTTVSFLLGCCVTTASFCAYSTIF
jgi:hypothetical protein